MADLGVFDKAKQVREQAAAKAAELREQASARAAQLKESVATTASDVSSSVAAKAGDVRESLATAAADAREASANKIKEAIDEFNATLLILREAGYKVSEVDIAIGLPPKISASVVASDAVTDEHITKILEEHQHKKLTTLVLNALYQAWRLQSAIQIVGMKPRGMSIELGLVPSVTIKFIG
jgi:hypothetical protein